MHSIKATRVAALFIFVSFFMQTCLAFFWFQPPPAQSLEDCLRLREAQGPYLTVPAHCEQLLKRYGLHSMHSGGGMTSAAPVVPQGWGWGSWGDWLEDSCPESCGRRCRVRRRFCMGPYHLSCANDDGGKAYEFENCVSRPNGNEGGDGGGGGGDGGFNRRRVTTASSGGGGSRNRNLVRPAENFDGDRGGDQEGEEDTLSLARKELRRRRRKKKQP